ncbi:MAG: acetyl-CoA decarbonylase/synthase complex subunit gamma [Candidatus Omnitrophota bacterium]
MALSGLDIYKVLPKTNCRDCGFPTCLAFAMQLAKKAVSLDKCPHLTAEAKGKLEQAALPPIRLAKIGKDDRVLEIGNESVMFRHEEKFHHPCGIGFILEDSLSDAELDKNMNSIKSLRFERIGQELKPDLVAISQTKSDKERFLKILRAVLEKLDLNPVLMSSDEQTLKEALELSKDKKPLIYAATNSNYKMMTGFSKNYGLPLVVKSDNLDDLSQLVKSINDLGVEDLILDPGTKGLGQRISDLTQIRRLALKKSFRQLGYPTIAVISERDPYKEVIQVSSLLAKYASIILMKGLEPWQALSIFTLRQNIYSDPQKPLQVEPKVYPIGKVSDISPLLVTTNFSLSYYTVLSEVEASKVPSYIMSVDTEGMSVLTAWAAEKFTADKVTEAINKNNLGSLVSHKKVIIPGYVAVMSGDLEDKSGWQIVVGPREASGIPSFLKKL